MKRNPHRYRVLVQISLYRGPNYLRSLKFRVSPTPQEKGAVDVWFEVFVSRVQETVRTWASEAPGS